MDQREIGARGLYQPAWIRLIATPGLRLLLPVLAARPVRRLSGTALLYAFTAIRSDSARERFPGSYRTSVGLESRTSYPSWVAS